MDEEEKSVDFVLVYSTNKHSKKEDAETREIFLKNLNAEGVETSDECEKNGNFFIKLHATQEALSKYAELLRWQMPVKKNVLCDEKIRKWSTRRRKELHERNSTTNVKAGASKYRIHYEYSRAKNYL